LEEEDIEVNYMEERIKNGLHAYTEGEAAAEEVAEIATAIAYAEKISARIEESFLVDPKGTLQHKYLPLFQQLRVKRPFRLNDLSRRGWAEESRKKSTNLTALGYRRGVLLQWEDACEQCQNFEKNGNCNGCVVVPELQKVDGFTACMNCNYQGFGSSCSLQATPISSKYCSSILELC
jgi:hypothetical protein